MARFSEVFRYSGVDESPNVPGKSKVPGMVVATGGSNIVALGPQHLFGKSKRKKK